MSSLVLSFDDAQELFNSEDNFPVDFELGWQWLGYSRKDNARKKLVGNFEKGIDYIELDVDETAENSTQQESKPDLGGRPTEIIRLTVNCFKEMGMMARTQKGKEVRQYFLKCEQIAKQFLKDNRDIVRGTQLTNELNQKYEELRAVSPVMADNFLQNISPISVSKGIVTENDLNSSLVANRIGLAFNKHIKAFDILRDATSPEAFAKLKEEYLKLADEHQQLLKVKTPSSTIEYVEKLVVDPTQARTIEALKLDLKLATQESSELQSDIIKLMWKIEELETKLHEEKNKQAEAKGEPKSFRFPTDPDRYKLPPSNN